MKREKKKKREKRKNQNQIHPHIQGEIRLRRYTYQLVRKNE
jgi:hypothetical protein